MESKKAKLRKQSHQELGGGGNGKVLVKGYKLPVRRLTSSGDLMHSMVTITNNTVLYLNVAKRVDPKYSPQKKKW